jgi:hypothetical protein
MKGVILAYDRPVAKGLLRADDGNRYEFSFRQWRSDGIPAPGGEVDFDLIDGAPSDIIALGVPPNDRAGGGQDAAAPGFQFRPPLIFAAIILVGCALPLIAMPFLPAGTLSLFGMFDWISLASASSKASGQDTSGAIFYYVVYLIPILAAWVAIEEIAKHGAGKGVRIASGLSCLLPALLYTGWYIVASLSPPESSNRSLLAIPLGLGAYLIAVGGVLMFFVGAKDDSLPGEGA